MMSFAEFKPLVDYDLVGVVAPEAFAGLPATENPAGMFPDARSVVVLGKRLRRGSFRAMEEGSHWSVVGRWLTNMEDVVRIIERHGHECVPFTPMDALRMPAGEVRAGQCRPNSFRLSLEYAAVAAGLGEIGYHGMFMTRQYGIRQALGLLVTDMEIEPGPGRQPGMESACDQCHACAQACPMQAISLEQTANLAWHGQQFTVGAINALACRACPNGVAGDTKYFAGAEELHFEVVNNQTIGDQTSRFAGSGLPNRLAAACGRACIAQFEARHPGKYHLPFRIRPSWGFRPDQPRGN